MNTWPKSLKDEQQRVYFKETLAYIKQRRQQGVKVYPTESEIFSAFEVPTFEKIKVVIIGQDPYHGEGQAHGLCFSVQPEIKIPPSLVNIYKELAADISGFQIPEHGYLQKWAEQGVLLLNTVLTVEQGQAHSHKHLGWEQFTTRVLEILSEECQDLVFILWGAHAQKKGKVINQSKHTVLQGPHPSPLSAYRGFFGCKHFSKTNEVLKKLGKTEINWQV